jgi:DNA-binding XRE family transcriptional regulator
MHRVNLGLSPEQFGWQIGVSGMTVRRIEEGGNVRTRTAFLLAQNMGLHVTDLWPVSTRSGAPA